MLSYHSVIIIHQYYGHIEGMKSLVFFQGSEFDFSEMVLQKMQAALEKWDKNPTGKRKKRGKCKKSKVKLEQGAWRLQILSGLQGCGLGTHYPGLWFRA